MYWHLEHSILKSWKLIALYFVYLSFRLCVCFACDVSCGLLVSNRIFDVTCQSLIKDEKKNTPQLFSTKCRQWNLGFDLSHCKKKICTSKCLKLLIVFGWYQDVPNRFFFTDIRRVPIDNRNTLRVRRLNVYDLDVLFFQIENTHNSSSIIPLGKI